MNEQIESVDGLPKKAISEKEDPEKLKFTLLNLVDNFKEKKNNRLNTVGAVPYGANFIIIGEGYKRLFSAKQRLSTTEGEELSQIIENLKEGDNLLEAFQEQRSKSTSGSYKIKIDREFIGPLNQVLKNINLIILRRVVELYNQGKPLASKFELLENNNNDLHRIHQQMSEFLAVSKNDLLASETKVPREIKEKEIEQAIKILNQSGIYDDFKLNSLDYKEGILKIFRESLNLDSQDFGIKLNEQTIKLTNWLSLVWLRQQNYFTKETDSSLGH